MASVPENERWEIVELYFKGRSQRKIGEATGRTLKTVNRIVRAFKSFRRIKDAPRKRKPRSRVTTEQEDAWIAAAAAVKPGLSAQQIKNTLDFRASVRTVKRRLREAGLKSRIVAQKPLLRAQNKEKRLQFWDVKPHKSINQSIDSMRNVQLRSGSKSSSHTSARSLHRAISKPVFGALTTPGTRQSSYKESRKAEGQL
ncbi:hypothetical protein HPB50_010327 [Hyalomma asiaticum]|uniref:Uncharacterized protein n=1 Tax=Hyalomma asiaticum TaxID=266040 RepID=A0ACB7RQB7_HYAAI|nr:hypothetical protein HPB50_010327 [Hyalomma asiaticum]